MDSSTSKKNNPKNTSRRPLAPPEMNHIHHPSRKKPSAARWGSPLNVITHLMVGAVCFQLGLVVGGGRQANGGGSGDSASTSRDRIRLAELACPESDPVAPRRARLAKLGKRLEVEDGALFPPSLRALFVGAARVNRTEFANLVDVGVPWDPSKPENDQVLVLYSSEKSLPGRRSTAKYQVADSPTEEAIENCHALKVVLLQPGKANHCVALVGQWESHHVHLFRRVPPEEPVVRGRKGPDMMPRKELPLRYVRRSIGDDGTEAHGLGTPSLRETKDNWAVLTEYLSKLDSTLQRLRPLAKAAAGDGKAVVVMMVNFGQALLFENFVCAAKSRNLDLSNVLMFATDKAAADLATSLGVKVFDVQDAFGELPEDAARFYGDPKFRRMMLAKVYCVHLVVLLGYDVLFQDVDIVWQRHPLHFFYTAPQARDFDVLFQDDGSRSVRYAPYSPNSGFYFVRNNIRTQYFFSVLVRSGDLVIKYRSHQAALTALLSEHASWKGLRVKVFGRDTEDGTLFPGGYHYHRRKDFMKRMLQGQVDPYIFHMSWTESKDNKLLFLKQFGEWYVKPECEGKKFEDVAQGNAGHDRVAACCSAEPLVQCFYRDKPSKIPCRGSDPIDKGRPSFW